MLSIRRLEHKPERKLDLARIVEGLVDRTELDAVEQVECLYAKVEADAQ